MQTERSQTILKNLSTLYLVRLLNQWFSTESNSAPPRGTLVMSGDTSVVMTGRGEEGDMPLAFGGVEARDPD